MNTEKPTKTTSLENAYLCSDNYNFVIIPGFSVAFNHENEVRFNWILRDAEEFIVELLEKSKMSSRFHLFKAFIVLTRE